MKRICYFLIHCNHQKTMDFQGGAELRKNPKNIAKSSAGTPQKKWVEY